MQLSEDETKLLITNKKPVNVEWVLAASIAENNEENKNNQEKSFDSKIDYNHDDNGLENEEILKAVSQKSKHKKYNLKQSQTTCNLDEVESILYGGFSSRFWMYRKHINVSEPSKFPFYAW